MESLEGVSLQELRDAAEVGATVAAAYEAGIFAALAEAPDSPARVAERARLDARATAIVLAALADLGLVERDGERYALTPDGRRRLTEPESPEFEGGGLRLWIENLRAWSRLSDVLRTGEPISRPGEPDDVDAIASFMAGMATAPADRVRRVIELCLHRRPGARRVLDLGGGPGHFSRAFLDAGVETVTLLDRPATVDYVADAYGLQEVPGLRLVGADMLADPLPDGPFDIVLLSNIVHMFSEEQNAGLLRRVARITTEGGVVAIADFVRGRSPRAARFAIIMLLRTDGGDTFTEAQLAHWLTTAGFRDVRTDDLDPERQLVTAIRAAG